MSYQVTLNSQNVLVPIALQDRNGEGMTGMLTKLHTATAMMIRISCVGGFTQEFFPLRISQDVSKAYSGVDWELWVQKTGADLYAYYLGIPDRFFVDSGSGQAIRSLSVEVVGASPLTGREDFSGGVDVTLQAHVEPPLVPGFLNLSERFFPTLLPQNFIENNALEIFEFQGRRQLVLRSALQIDSATQIPVSLEKHWDPKNWVQGVVENLAADRYFVIRGGCFYARNQKITHWFGGTIGLEERAFRNAATEKIQAMHAGANGSWVFWLEASGSEDFDVDGLVKSFVESGKNRVGVDTRLSIRHSMMHRFLSHSGVFSTTLRDRFSLPVIPVPEAAAALAQVARILANHQPALQLAKSEPAHADWSKVKDSSTSFGIHVRLAGLEEDIRELYLRHGETLRALEAMFDETYGYSAWDAVGNPLRETLMAYLAGRTADLPIALGVEVQGRSDSP